MYFISTGIEFSYNNVYPPPALELLLLREGLKLACDKGASRALI